MTSAEQRRADRALAALFRATTKASIAEAVTRARTPAVLAGSIESLNDEELDIVHVRVGNDALSSDPTQSNNYGNPGVIAAVRLGETSNDDSARVTFDGPSGASAMRTSAESRVVLPFGAESGLRIVLDGETATINVGDLNAARVQLDPEGGIRITNSDGTLVALLDPTQGLQIRDGVSGIVQSHITDRGFSFTNDTATESIVLGTTPGLPSPRYASTPVASGAAGVVPTPSVTAFGAADLEVRHAALFDAANDLSATTVTPPASYTEILDTTNYWATGSSTVAVAIATRQPQVSAAVRNFTDSSNLFNRVLGTTVVVEGVVGGTAPSVRSTANGFFTYTSVSTEFTISRGTVATGDIMLAFVTFANDGGSVPSAWTTPKGWVFLGGQFASITNTLASGVWAKLAGPGEPASETIKLNKVGGPTPTQVHWAVVAVQDAKLLPEYTDVRVNGASVPRGRVVSRTNSSGSVTIGGGAPSGVLTLPGTPVTVTNLTGGTRRYQATAGVRARMFAGFDGVYRILVTNGGTSALAGSVTQLHTNVAGSTGEVGGLAQVEFTVAPGASQTVGAGGQRISGGNSSDTLETGFIFVDDIGE